MNHVTVNTDLMRSFNVIFDILAYQVKNQCGWLLSTNDYRLGNRFWKIRKTNLNCTKVDVFFKGVLMA